VRTPFLADYQTSDYRLLPRGVEIAIHFWRRLPVQMGYVQEFRRRAICEKRDVHFWWGVPEIKSDWVACEYPDDNGTESSEPEDYRGLLADEPAIELVRQESLFHDGYALFQFKDISNCCLCFCSIREDKHNQIIVQLGSALVIETHHKVEALVARELEQQNIDSGAFIEASDLCRSWFGRGGSLNDTDIPRFRTGRTIPDILEYVRLKHVGWREDAKAIKAADASLRKLSARLATNMVVRPETRGRKPKPLSASEKRILAGWKSKRFKRYEDCDLAFGEPLGKTKTVVERARKRIGHRNRPSN
jgi:hypothetical protein